MARDEDYFPFARHEEKPTNKQSLEESVEMFHKLLSIEFKKKLWSWRREDSEVAIVIDVYKGVVKAGLEQAWKSKFTLFGQARH